MFITFLGELRAAGLPVSITEYLTLLEATEADLAGKGVEDFYFLARTCLVKDETRVDKFDRVFAHVFQGLDTLPEAIEAEVPTEWLLKLTERWLSEEDKAKIAALGGLEKLLETLKERLAEQKGRHQGGSKWIGTGGTSPFGHVELGDGDVDRVAPLEPGQRLAGGERSRFGGGAASPAPARPRSSTSRAPLAPRRGAPSSTCACGRSVTMP